MMSLLGRGGEGSMRVPAGLVVAVSVLLATQARAQAPPTGPLVLRLPATPRAASLGNAWVAGSDHEVVFYNPAQLIGTRGAFDVSVVQIGSDSTMATLGSAYAAGRWSLTFGWGVQAVRFSADPAAPYPYSPDVLLSSGPADQFSSLFVVGGAIVIKNFRIGAAGKYALESVPSGATATAGPSQYESALVADLGVSRRMWGGVVAGSVQNLGGTSNDRAPLTLPRQLLVGYAISRPAGPLDLGIYSQVTIRGRWTSPAGGLSVGYSWLQGYNIAFRVGAHRPESTSEFPLAFGAAFSLDRFTIEYALRIFDGGRTSNGVTVRWR
jgi:hypothetical protein